MKNTFEHLPQRKQDELARIASIIREKAPATEMIILFGSYARGDWVEDVTVEGNTTYEYSSDYDILVIVEDEPTANKNGFWYEIENKAGKLPVQTPLTIIAHDINFVNRKLETGQYFFTDIKKEGILLYDSGHFKLSQPRELSPKERLGMAKANFKEYFHSAEVFIFHYKNALEINEYKSAAFMLHQAVETFYATVLLVYTNYKPKTHKLDKLCKMAGRYDPAFLKTFPMDTDEQRRCFDLLKQAYVGARYDASYKITEEELKYLAGCVELLKDQTKTSCEKKMESFV